MAVKFTGPFRQRARDPDRAHGGRRLTAVTAAVAIATAAVALCWCYTRLAATFSVGSDGASNALEAWDMWHGNWLLHGWTLTDVSFYPTELPEYAVVELWRGLRPDVVDIAAGLTYTLLVLAAAAAARGRARGAEGWVRGLIAAGIMAAPQLGNGVHVLVSQPDHVGTQVLILGIFVLVERAQIPKTRGRWYTPAGIFALLTVAIVADKITIVDAVVPLAFVGLVHAAWARRPAEHLFELSLALAAGAAVPTAAGVLAGLGRLGGFQLLPVQTALTGPDGLAGHLELAWHGVLNLLGADVFAAAPGTQTALAWLHAPGVALAVAGFAVAAWHVPSQRDLMSDVLAVGIVVNLAGFVASVIPATPFDTREIAALLPFGAVLAGRVFGARVTVPRVTVSQVKLRLIKLQPGAAALTVAGACQLAALGYGTAQPAAADPARALAGWLAAHGLTTGLGTFNEGNLTTLDSGGAVRLRTVTWSMPRPGSPGGAVARLYQSDASWYDPATQYANFVVTVTAGAPSDLIPYSAILALAGPPARTYQFQSFTVMVWGENLLELLGPSPSHLPGDVGHT